nr:MAG TPA: hypothetical protein [Caudoviricetes sp.]
MRFTTTTFLAAVEQIADQISVQLIFATELGNAHTVAVKSRAGLLGCKGGGHSVHVCSFVLMWGHS